MVTFNVKTELDVANGSCGEIVRIKLDQHESSDLMTQSGIVELQCLPASVLVQMHRTTQTKRLEGLDEGVVPLVPLEQTFKIHHEGR